MASSRVVHKGASEGFKDADSYDAYRPSYPDEAVDEFLKQLGLVDFAHANVVEIAAGTGKFTEIIASRHESYDVVAVEPVAQMREKLAKKNLRGVKVVEGLAASLPVGDEWGDACIAAQSFHWFSTDEALTEIHRVLKPTSVFGMIWNIEDYNKPADWKASTAWEQQLNDLLFSLGSDGVPRFRNHKWRDVFQRQLGSNKGDGAGSGSGFRSANPLRAIRDVLTERMPRFSLPLGEHSVRWTSWLDEAALARRVGTLSQVAVLRGAEREAFDVRVGEIIRGKDAERNEKGEIAVHGVTFFAWTSRL